MSISSLFNNINRCATLEPTDTSCNDMTVIANNVNLVNRRLSDSSAAAIISGNRTPEMKNPPAIINGLLIEKYINNKINTYFDKIYILNSDSRLDYWLDIKKILNYHEIFNYKRFSIPHHSLTKCPPNILKSLLSDSIKNKYKSILILQDNIILHNNFKKLFNKNMTHIPPNWNILYFAPHNNTCVIGINSVIFNTLIDLSHNNLITDCFKKIKIRYEMNPSLVIPKSTRHMSNFSTKLPYINDTISIIMVYHANIDAINFENAFQSLMNQDILKLYPTIKLEIVIINNTANDITNLITNNNDDPDRIDIKVYPCPLNDHGCHHDTATCYNLGIGLSTGFYITFQNYYFVSNTNRLTQQFHDINNYNVDISISTYRDKFVPETLFFNRHIVNKLGYIEHNLNSYLHKLLLKYHCCKTTDIIYTTSSPPFDPSSSHITEKHVKYYPFLDNSTNTLGSQLVHSG